MLGCRFGRGVCCKSTGTFSSKDGGDGGLNGIGGNGDAGSPGDRAADDESKAWGAGGDDPVDALGIKPFRSSLEAAAGGKDRKTEDADESSDIARHASQTHRPFFKLTPAGCRKRATSQEMYKTKVLGESADRFEVSLARRVCRGSALQRQGWLAGLFFGLLFAQSELQRLL